MCARVYPKVNAKEGKSYKVFYFCTNSILLQSDTKRVLLKSHRRADDKNLSFGREEAETHHPPIPLDFDAFRVLFFSRDDTATHDDA